MNPLHITFNGIDFVNPFMIAASPSSDGREKELRALEAGWGGIVFKTVSTEKRRPKLAEPNMGGLPFGAGRQMAFYNYDLISERSIEDVCDDIRLLKERFPDRVLCGSIMAGSPEEWKELVEKLEDAGADMIECSMSCPQGDGSGRIPAADAGLLKDTVAVIKSFIRKDTPLIVKMTPNVTDIGAMAEAAKEGGADSVCAIDTVRSFIGINIWTGQPKLNVAGKSTFGGLSGTAIKPIALGCVASVAKKIPGFPVAGVGGITNYEDALEFMMLGCGVVEICSAINLYGFDMVKQLCARTRDFLEVKGVSELSKIQGSALSSIVTQEELSRGYRGVCTIDRERCVKCRRCVTACRDCGFGALSAPDREIQVDAALCRGCGACAIVCSRECISIRER